MVGLINPSSNKTLDDYKKRASGLSTGVSPGNGSFGGKFVDSDDSDDKSDDKDSSGDDKNSTSSDNGGDDSKDDKGAAGSIRVPVFSLLAVVGLAFSMA